jgi:hypothetical protein
MSLGVVLVAILVGMINYLGYKYFQRWDWTSTDLYTLSDKSKGLLASLDRDIEAVVFMGPEAELYDPVMELLARYDAESPRFSLRVVDPVKNLLEAQQLADRFQLTQPDVVVFDSGADRRVVESIDLAEYDYSGLQFGAGPEMTGFKGEQIFTSSILELVEDRKPKILFTVGHGELSLDELGGRGLGQAADLLRQDNFDLEEWESLGQSVVPSSADLVVIAGPTSNFIEPEIGMLSDYLEGGGRLLVFLDPVLAERGGLVTTGLEDLLTGYGIDVGSDIVVDPANPIPFFGSETFFVGSYGDHPVTRSLDQAAVPTILRLARSVSGREISGEGEVVTELLLTSAEGWGETDLENLGELERDSEDLAGPVSLGVVVGEGAGSDAATPASEDDVSSPSVTKRDRRIMVFGDSDFVANSQLANVGNTELLLSAVNWLAERENLVGIPPKEPEQVRLSLTEAQLRSTAWLVFGVLPGLAVAAGALVLVRRRR